MRPLLRLPAAAALAAAAAGCSVLPSAHTEVESRWKSFDEARMAVQAIVPHESTVADLRACGIDPYTSPNVELLSFSDIVRRFPLDGRYSAERLDGGLRECIEAGQACSGYSVDLRDIRRERTGSFLADFFGFKRTVDVSGWTFNALVLLVDDRVVYTLHGGQPIVRAQELSRQPLGPAQDVGKSLPPSNPH
ncbi:MAG TPA: hypothetical protein VLS49_17300 [Usitatibacter sp.]|nr:hypothetical protein [Usitatibacter sp.]